MPVKPRSSPARALAYKTLGIALLANRQRRVDEHLDERDLRCFVQRPSISSGRSIGRHQRDQRNRSRVCQQTTYLCHTADVLVAVRSPKAEIAVQAVANVVTVKDIGEPTGLDKSLFHRNGDAGLSGTRQTGEPHRCSRVDPGLPNAETVRGVPDARRCLH